MFTFNDDNLTLTLDMMSITIVKLPSLSDEQETIMSNANQNNPLSDPFDLYKESLTASGPKNSIAEIMREAMQRKPSEPAGWTRPFGGAGNGVNPNQWIDDSLIPMRPHPHRGPAINPPPFANPLWPNTPSIHSKGPCVDIFNGNPHRPPGPSADSIAQGAERADCAQGAREALRLALKSGNLATCWRVLAICSENNLNPFSSGAGETLFCAAFNHNGGELLLWLKERKGFSASPGQATHCLAAICHSSPVHFSSVKALVESFGAGIDKSDQKAAAAAKACDLFDMACSNMESLTMACELPAAPLASKGGKQSI